MTIERDGNAVILHGIAGDGGCLSNPDNLRILLTASFLGAETDGRRALRLGTHRGNRAVWKRFDAFTDYPDFEAAINAFLAQLIHWKARIDALPSVAVSASATFTPGGSWFKAILGKGGKTFLETPHVFPPL